MSGHYDEGGRHICPCGAPSTYQMFSGGKEFYCPSCGTQGTYPEGDGGPRARLLTIEDGALKLRRMVYEEMGRRKETS